MPRKLRQILNVPVCKYRLPKNAPIPVCIDGLPIRVSFVLQLVYIIRSKVLIVLIGGFQNKQSIVFICLAVIRPPSGEILPINPMGLEYGVERENNPFGYLRFPAKAFVQLLYVILFRFRGFFAICYDCTASAQPLIVSNEFRLYLHDKERYLFGIAQGVPPVSPLLRGYAFRLVVTLLKYIPMCNRDRFLIFLSNSVLSPYGLHLTRALLWKYHHIREFPRFLVFTKPLSNAWFMFCFCVHHSRFPTALFWGLPSIWFTTL